MAVCLSLLGLSVTHAANGQQTPPPIFVYTPRIDDPAADYTGPGSGDNRMTSFAWCFTQQSTASSS